MHDERIVAIVAVEILPSRYYLFGVIMDATDGDGGIYSFYDSKQQGRRVPRDKGRMLDAPRRLGTASQTAEAAARARARQSRDSTDYSTDAISVHIYTTRFPQKPASQTSAIHPLIDRPLIDHRSNPAALARDEFLRKRGRDLLREQRRISLGDRP